MVRVLAVADEVVESVYDSRVRDLQPELVIAAGDLPWDYLEFLSSCLNVPVVFVPGNHDPEVLTPKQSHGQYFDAGIPCDSPRPAARSMSIRVVVEVVGLHRPANTRGTGPGGTSWFVTVDSRAQTPRAISFAPGATRRCQPWLPG